MATTPAKRAWSVCGTLLADDSAHCPVCALQQALGTQAYSVSNTSSELRFEHYTVLQNAEGKPFELGRGAMGVTYKAFDVRLQRPAALKIINPQLFGNESARARFVREARAAGSVRHQNVASVFHIGESGGNYYYAMELVEGESLSALLRRSGYLGTDLAALGRKPEAIQEAKRAVEMLPVSEDAVDGPYPVYNLAAVYSMVNERDLAFQQLAISVKTPGGATYGTLKLDPCWDPLRKDPRFDKLLVELAPRD